MGVHGSKGITASHVPAIERPDTREAPGDAGLHLELASGAQRAARREVLYQVPGAGGGGADGERHVRDTIRRIHSRSSVLSGMLLQEEDRADDSSENE